MASEDAFKLMPKELTELILSGLEPVDLANLSGVNHHWRKLASSDLLWRRFFDKYNHLTEPLKLVYGNRNASWMKRNYKLSILEHPHGTFDRATILPNNVLRTGSLSGMTEEWDMEKGEKICEYDMPDSMSYRTDETHCLLDCGSALKRWKIDKNAKDGSWSFVFDKMVDENGKRVKYFRKYQFVRERCFMATVESPGILIVHLYDMDKNECLWKHEVKVFQTPTAEYPPRFERNALAMSYDFAAIVYQEQAFAFDLNKHEMKFHWKYDEEGENEHVRGFSVCTIHKDTLLVSKRAKTNFYDLKDGELLFSVPTSLEAFRSTVNWATMDSEKAIVSSHHEAYLIDIRKRSLVGQLDWSSVARGLNQDMAMNDDFFVVLAEDKVVLFDFRKRTKEQELKDAEELKKKQEEHARQLQEER